tara:strand:- start:1254 stop:1424 length:171 start_codon:yes stop_codon:yes gene_type:complete
MKAKSGLEIVQKLQQDKELLGRLILQAGLASQGYQLVKNARARSVIRQMMRAAYSK